MAYLASIEQKCFTCGKRASVELRNSANGRVGVFCRPHGERRLKALKADELASARSGSADTAARP